MHALSFLSNDICNPCNIYYVIFKNLKKNTRFLTGIFSFYPLMIKSILT